MNNTFGRSNCCLGLLLALALACGGGGGGGNTTPTAVAPSITQQPSNSTVTLGQTATFSVAATGTPSPTYQWASNGSAIPGAISAAYDIPATAKIDDGTVFSVLVTNTVGNVTSQNATLTVDWAPAIISQPTNSAVTVGQTATFSVAADAHPVASFQWQKNDQNITGATSTSYTTAATSLSDSNSIFTVLVSNVLGSQTSNPATLTVNPAPVPPSITTQPQSTSVQVGQGASFSVAATGTAPLGYQWSLNGTPIASGGTSSTYTINSAQNSDSGSYEVVVNNVTNQPVTSDPATLTVTPVAVAPSISAQPSNVTVTVGNSASFSVTASGTAPLSYQWQRNQTNISGATQSTYTLSTTALTDNGAIFQCAVTNSAGGVTSQFATLTVNPSPTAPVITSFTASPSTINLGQSTTLAWAVTGATSLSINQGVGTVTGLTSTQVTPTTTGTITYTLTATNAVGSPTSTAQVTVNPATTYALTVNLGTGTTGTPVATTSYAPGTVINYSYSLQTGYTNLQVTLDGNAVPASGSVTMNGVHTLATAAQVQTFTITASAGANGTISPNGVTTVNYGGNQTYTITPASGFGVATVSVDGTSVGAVTTFPFTSISANHTITATFNSLPTLTVNLGTGVTGTPAATTSYSPGTVVNYSYSLQTGYQNLQVTLDGSSVPASGTVTMSAAHTLAAKAQVQTFTITSSALANGTISPNGVTTVNYGGSQTYVITPNPGYNNAGVFVDSISVGYLSTYTFSNVMANHTIQARFNTFDLYASMEAGVSGSPSTTNNYSLGTVVNWSYSLLTGYQNLQVTLDATPVAASGSLTMNASHTLSATAQIMTYVISSSAGTNGLISPAGATTVNYGSNQIYTISPNAGYQVASVLVDGTSVGAVTSYTFNNVTTSHTISATFSAFSTFALTVNLGTGITGSPISTNSYTSGTIVNYSYSLQTGYTNLQVTLDGTTVAASGSITMNAVHTLSATAQAQTFTITASAGANGTISPNGVSMVNYGGNQTYVITPNTGYNVASVIVDGVSIGVVGTYPFNAVTANHTISATFSAITYTLTVNIGSGTLGTPTTTTNYQQGTVVSYSYSLVTGYQNLQVTLDGAAAPATGTITMNGAHTIATTAQIQTFSITSSAGANGTISPNGINSVMAGSGLTFTITPNSGYQVASVLVDGTSVGAAPSYTFSNVTSNHTISATFIGQPFTITSSAGPNGTISPSGLDVVNYGSSPTFTITPNFGYQVASVIVDGTSMGAVTSYTFSNVNSNHTITATFVVQTFIIQENPGPNGTISPNEPLGIVYVNYGSSPTFTITPNSGYYIGWVAVDGNSVGGVTSYTFSFVSSNHTISAAFYPNP